MRDQYNMTSSSDDPPEWLFMPYAEFDVMVNDIDERELELTGKQFEIDHLSVTPFSSPSFPVNGRILERNFRFMVPLVCQETGNPNEPSVLIWFLVDSGSPFTCLTMKSMKAIMGAKNEVYENSRFNVAIQDQNSEIECFVSKGHFNEVNILGADAILQLGLSIKVIDRKHFQLYK